MGPIGSGKSTACVIEILRRSQMQAPGPDGIRRTRWAIIRNSYPELRTTTLKTWGDWCPPSYGKLTMDSPIRHMVQTKELDMEILFLALDREEDARKLLSLELTGAWVNEAREVPKAIIDALTGRVGRYPSMNQGGCTWSGIIADTNPPDDQSWWYRLAEEDTPKDWVFFSQPPGDGPDAENTANLHPAYYERIKAGKDPDWIKVYVKGEYGFLVEGKAVFPMFRDRTHVSETPIVPTDAPLILAADFGLTPAAVIAQRSVSGRWLVIDELVTDNCGIIRFAELLTAYMAKHYPGHPIGMCWGDPAGNQRAHSDERTALDILREYTGWTWRPAPTNDLTMRLEVVKAALNRLIDGDPGLLISPKAPMIRKGFAGGYHYKFIKTGTGAQTHEVPAKNEYSHPMDALQYLLLGGGESHVVMRRKPRQKSVSGLAQGVDYNVFSGLDPGQGKPKDPIWLKRIMKHR